MKHLQLLFAVLFLLFTTLQAQQSFSLTPNPVFGVEKDDFMNEGQAMVKTCRPKPRPTDGRVRSFGLTMIPFVMFR